jgi:hypothetical protein
MARQTAAAAKPAPPRNLMALAKPAPGGKAEQAHTKPDLVEMPGLRLLAAIVEGGKTVEAVKLIRLGPLQQALLKRMAELGRDGTVPANYQGIEGEATASCQLRRKGSNQPLAPDQVQVLREAGVSVELHVVTPRTFIVNPAYVDDADMIKLAGDVLGQAGLPDDFIQQQEAVAWDVVGESALEDIFRLHGKDPPRARMLLEVAAIPVVVAKWNGDAEEAANLLCAELVDDAVLPAPERAVVKAKAIEKDREKTRYRPAA